VAGINDIPNFLGGQSSIDAGKAVVGTTGMYQAGFFPIMMFGLPGAALAIYHSAKKEHKEKAASIMIAAAFAAFFTGVTEPLEFSFMFVAFPLYVVHAVLTGLSLAIAYLLDIHLGFSFSAGLIDLLLYGTAPAAKNIPLLLIMGVVFFAIYYFLFRLVISGGTCGRQDANRTTSSTLNRRPTSPTAPVRPARPALPLLGVAEPHWQPDRSPIPRPNS
jgi:PTS system N-acetylglucosamine-specific IIC component